MRRRWSFPTIVVACPAFPNMLGYLFPLTRATSIYALSPLSIKYGNIFLVGLNTTNLLKNFTLYYRIIT
jgi:hypothetical protein